jgi:hypothetical protein
VAHARICLLKFIVQHISCEFAVAMVSLGVQPLDWLATIECWLAAGVRETAIPISPDSPVRNLEAVL